MTARLAPRRAAGFRPAPPGPDPLAAITLDQVLLTVEQLGSNGGNPQVIALYRGWIARQPPGTRGLPVAWFNLGVELERAGSPAEAMAAYRQALAIQPDFSEAATALGQMHERAGQTELALALWASALQPASARIRLHKQRARLLEQLGRLDEAEAEMRASLGLDPAQPDVIQHWVHVRQRLCLWPALDTSIPGLPREALIRHCGPLASLALFGDVATQNAVGASWIARKNPEAPERLAPLGGYRHRRLRLGYLSSDFCRHAMSYLIAELFERHDRARFEVFGYCASPEDGSEIRSRVLAAFDHVRHVRGLADEAAARLIRADEIDVLIDLNGLTSGTRLQVLRWRPAPVQATYLGFVGPVPLPELDALLCDGFVIPPGTAAAYTPRPWPVGDLYQANDSKRLALAATTRAEAGLPEDRFVFCSFSNHYKITEAMFAAWMRILRETGESVLWLAIDNVWSRSNLRARAAAAGIAPERLIFADRADPQLYMARLRLPDLFLDTHPYNSGTVASDALRMGLPMVTLAGEAFASRMASRLLKAIGAEAGIAATEDEYVAKAVRLATDPAAHAAFRAQVTEQRWTETIGDIAGFTRQFETSLLALQAAFEAGTLRPDGPAR